MSQYQAIVVAAQAQAVALSLIVCKSEIASCLSLNVFQSAVVKYQFVVAEAAQSFAIIVACVSSQVFTQVWFQSFVLSCGVINK